MWNWLKGRVGGGASAVQQTAAPATNAPAPCGEQPAAAQAGDWWVLEHAGLTELRCYDRLDLPPEARALENTLIAHFDGHDLDLPPLPRVAERVIRKLSERNTSLAAVAREISEDQVIAGAVLRLANSPLYRGTNAITSLERAVTRLGTNALRTLMLQQSMRGAMFHTKGTLARFAESMWNRSLAGAYVMRRLAEFTCVHEDHAFLIGLIHDIGNVIVLREAERQHRMMKHELSQEVFEYICHECHQEFGELIADAWGLPDELKDVIADHHGVPEADDPLRAERLLAQVSDMIVSLIGFGPEAPYDLLNARPVQALGLCDQPGFLACLRSLPDWLDQVMEV